MNVCLQEGIPQISHSELTDLEAIGQGGFGVAYRAKHARFGTVVYKKLNAEKLGTRYEFMFGIYEFEFVLISSATMIQTERYAMLGQ